MLSQVIPITKGTIKKPKIFLQTKIIVQNKSRENVRKSFHETRDYQKVFVQNKNNRFVDDNVAAAKVTRTKRPTRKKLLQGQTKIVIINGKSPLCKDQRPDLSSLFVAAFSVSIFGGKIKFGLFTSNQKRRIGRIGLFKKWHREGMSLNLIAEF